MRLDKTTNELTLEFKKRSSTINEAEERLASRERAVLREKQLADEQINWERKNLRLMRDAWTKEQERHTKLLAEEREAVAIERSKLDVLNRLKSGSDDMAKVEVRRAILKIKYREHYNTSTNIFTNIDIINISFRFLYFNLSARSATILYVQR